MRSYTFNVATVAALACLITITRRDGTVYRITNWSQTIRIGSTTWVPGVGLKLFDIGERNDGSPSTTQIEFSAYDGGLFDPEDVAKEVFAEAELLIQICDPLNPAGPDFHFYGKFARKGQPLHGAILYEVVNPFSRPRYSLVAQFTLMCRHIFGGPICGVPIHDPRQTADTIQRSTAYALGDKRINLRTAPNDYGNVFFEVTTAGTTASSAPSFNYSVSATTTDNSVVWTARNSLQRSVEVDTVPDRHSLVFTADPDPPYVDWEGPGKLLLLSGTNKHRVFSIGLWDETNLRATFRDAIGDCTQSGDVGLLWPHCDKTRTGHNKFVPFTAAKIYGGFPYFEGAKAASQLSS